MFWPKINAILVQSPNGVLDSRNYLFLGVLHVQGRNCCQVELDDIEIDPFADHFEVILESSHQGQQGGARVNIFVGEVPDAMIGILFPDVFVGALGQVANDDARYLNDVFGFLIVGLELLQQYFSEDVNKSHSCHDLVDRLPISMVDHHI